MSSLGPAQRKDLSDAQSEADDQGESHEAQAHAEAGQPQRRLMHGPGAGPQTQHPPSHKKGGSRGSRDKGLIGFWGRKLYRQPTRRGFSAVGTIVTIHRGGAQDRSSWTARTVPKNLEPFKLSSAGRPRYWTKRQRRASTGLVISTVCTMTSSGQARTRYQSNLNLPFKVAAKRSPSGYMADCHLWAILPKEEAGFG